MWTRAAEFSEAIGPSIDAGILEVSHDRQRYRFRHALLQEALDEAMHPSRRMHWHERWARTLTDGAAPLSAHEAAILVAQHWSAAGTTPRRCVARSTARGQRLSCPRRSRRPSCGNGPCPCGRRTPPRCTESRAESWPFEPRELCCSRPSSRSFSPGCGPCLVAPRATRRWTHGAASWSSSAPSFLAVPGPTYVTTSGVPDLVDRLVATGTSWPAMDAIDSLWHEFPTQHVEMFERTDEVLSRMAHALGDDHMVRGVMRHRAMFALETGRAEDSLGHVQEELEDARTRSPLDLRIAQGNFARVLLATGRAAEAVAFGEQSLGTFAAPDAAPFLWSVLAMHHGRALLALGRMQECLELADRALQVAGKDAVLRGLVGPLSIKVHARRGQLGAARSLLEDIERSAPPEIAFDGVWSWYWSAYADLTLASGDLSLLPRQRALLTDPVLIPSSDWVWEPLVNSLRAAITPLTGRLLPPPRAPSCSRPWTDSTATARWGGPGHPRSRPCVPGCRGKTPPRIGGPPSTGGRRCAIRFDEAVCRLRLAESLISHGERPAAEHELQLAMELAQSLGAEPLQDAISRVGRSTRIGGRRESSAGTLTAREAEVLRQVALGRTNQQIAGELFMSPKTVSVHVSRIITKLGAGNRTEAVAIGRGRGMLD